MGSGHVTARCPCNDSRVVSGIKDQSYEQESTGHGTGAAAFDLDGDGLLELLVSHGVMRRCDVDTAATAMSTS